MRDENEYFDLELGSDCLHAPTQVMFSCMCGTPDVVDETAETSDPAASDKKSADASFEPAAEPEPEPPLAVKNDAVFEDFKQKLTAGIPVIKHCSDKQGRKRLLFVDSSFSKVGVCEQGKNSKHPMLPLDSVKEVRKATDLDPATTGGSPMCGTKTLRDSMHVSKKNHAFSLIFSGTAKATLDFECATEAECATLVGCFRMLLSL